MNTNKLKQIGVAVCLLGVVMPAISLADCCNDSKAVLDQINTKVTGTGDYLYNLWNFQKDDLSLKQGVTALINFQAAENVKQYNRDQQLLFMTAPGTDDALAAGVVVGGSNNEQRAMDMATKAIIGYYSLMTAEDQITLFGNILDLREVTQQNDAVLMLNKMKTFFTEGNADVITSVNPAALMHTSNLNTIKLSDDDAQKMITLLTNPYPNIDKGLRRKLKDPAGFLSLNYDDRETVANKMISGAIMGLSTSAFADIVIRRKPSMPDGKSVMDVMDEYSKQRFVNPDWYKTVGAASEASLLREIAHMQAYSIWVQNQQFRVSEQQMALLASMNAVLAKTDVLLQEMLNEYMTAKKEAEAYKAESEEKLKKLEEE